MFNAIQDANYWSNSYQGRGGLMNKGRFLWHNLGESHDDPSEDDNEGIRRIRAGIDAALPAFNTEISKFNLSRDQLKEQLFKTAIHESKNGTLNRQITSDGQADGRGRGYWMIEASTAMDLLQGGAKRRSSRYLGEDADKILKEYGLSAETLHDLGKGDLSALGRTIQNNPVLGAIFAGAKYMQRLRGNEDVLRD